MANFRSLSKETITQIDHNLKLHTNYKGASPEGNYLTEMDRLATINRYAGPKAMALSNMLTDYYNAVGVTNLSEALARILSHTI